MPPELRTKVRHRWENSAVPNTSYRKSHYRAALPIRITMTSYRDVASAIPAISDSGCPVEHTSAASVCGDSLDAPSRPSHYHEAYGRAPFVTFAAPEHSSHSTFEPREETSTTRDTTSAEVRAPSPAQPWSWRHCWDLPHPYPPRWPMHIKAIAAQAPFAPSIRHPTAAIKGPRSVRS